MSSPLNLRIPATGAELLNQAAIQQHSSHALVPLFVEHPNLFLIVVFFCGNAFYGIRFLFLPTIFPIDLFNWE